MLTPESSPSSFRRLAALVIAAAFMLVTTHALASEEPGVTSPPTLRIGGALTGGYAFMHRSVSSPSDRAGLAEGLELHVHPYSQHGFFAAATHAEGVFGPDVSILDAGYSWRFLGSARLKGLTGAGYFDVGPVFAFVRNVEPAPKHDVFGGRASVAFDAQLYNLSLGVVVGYRGGVPLGGAPDGWEGAFTSMLRLGVVLDVDTATAKKSESK